MDSRQPRRSTGAPPSEKPAAKSGPLRMSSTQTPGTAASHEGTTGSVQVGPVGHARILVGLTRPPAAAGNAESPSSGKRPRKDKGPNWSSQEIHALIAAKRNLFQEEVDTVDGRHLMTTENGKWLRISKEVMEAGVSSCLHDSAACKSKWNLIIPNYKRIADFLARSGTNEVSYWNLRTAERKAEGLPTSFHQDIFFHIHDWYGSRPAIMPPHTRDLLSNDDSNYHTPVAGVEDAGHGDGNDDGDEDDVFGADTSAGSEEVTASTQSPMARIGTKEARTLLGLNRPPATASPSATGKWCIPPSVTAQVLSSSDTNDGIMKRKTGNTGIRRKSVSGHSLIAEATRATGDAMTGQMKEMAEASRELEKSKIDVELRLFSEQMLYQRERDRRLHDNAVLANENAKLAIEKQGQVVSCLARLSTVLSAGIERREVSSGTCTVQGPAAKNYPVNAAMEEQQGWESGHVPLPTPEERQ